MDWTQVISTYKCLLHKQLHINQKMISTRHVWVYNIIYTNENKFKDLHERKLTTHTSKQTNK